MNMLENMTKIRDPNVPVYGADGKWCWSSVVVYVGFFR